jgi:peptide-methionine (S)-S-oxide reductase
MADTELATLAGGCFWCVEAALAELDGVESVTSGYTGGHTADPTYEAVCSGSTGHAEAVRVEFDPAVVSYREVLEAFFAIHDPTTEDRQGPDVGSQYRSAVYYHDEAQRETVEELIGAYEREGVYEGVVTEVEPAGEFYEAEAYHQDYYEKVKAGDPNVNSGYCQVQIPPKIEKVRSLSGKPARK